MEKKSRFNFEPNTHKYTLDGKKLTGVTTIIGVLDKPALISWAANCAVDFIKENSDTGKKGVDDFWTYSIKEEKLNEARTAWAKKRDKAGDIGTQCHAWIEQYAKSKINNTDYTPQYESDQVKKMVEKFIDWADTNKVKFLLSEQKLYSEVHWYAGTVDLVVEIDGKKYVADIKTAKDVYVTNFIQMGGYDIALKELGKAKDLAGYIVVNIPKELDKDGNAKIKVETKENVSEYQNAFLHCLALYRMLNKETPEKTKAVQRSIRANKA